MFAVSIDFSGKITEWFDGMSSGTSSRFFYGSLQAGEIEKYVKLFWKFHK